MSHIYIIFIIKSVVAIPTTTGETSFIYFLDLGTCTNTSSVQTYQ
jgi:hypothetical protein